jgi:hypothetical protein
MLENHAKAILFGGCFALILILLHSASADYCIDNNTASTNITVNGNTIPINTPCDYGCSNGSCDPSPLAQFLWIIGIGVILIVIFILLKKSGAIK